MDSTITDSQLAWFKSEIWGQKYQRNWGRAHFRLMLMPLGAVTSLQPLKTLAIVLQTRAHRSVSGARANQISPLQLRRGKRLPRPRWLDRAKPRLCGSK